LYVKSRFICSTKVCFINKSSILATVLKPKKMRKLLLAFMSVLFISTSGLQAQSCPGDNLSPLPADAAGVPQTSPAINDPTDPTSDWVYVRLNQFGVGAIASDSGQYNPSTGLGARMFVESAFTLNGGDSIFTTATDKYIDANGDSVLCSIPNSPKITASKTTFFCSDLGPNTVTLTYTDAANNTKTRTVYVMVVDGAPPVVVTQSATVSLDANGQYTLDPDEVDGGSTDNCLLSNIKSVTPNQFDCDDIGPNTVTLTLEDAAGNTASATATVFVEDNLPPTTIALSGQYVLYSNQLLNGEIAVTAVVLNPTSYDNCEITDTILTDVDSNLFYAPGQYVYEFTCDDVSYTDDDGVFIDKSRDIVIHNIDESGNWSRDTANVILIDVDAPSITVQNANVSLGADGTVDLLSDNYITAEDECGVDSIWLSQTEFDCSDLGSQVIYAYARDIHNNADSVQLTVTVVDDLDPIITLVQSSISLYLDPVTGEASLPANVSSLATATDNCTDPQSVTLSQTDFDCSDVPTAVVVVTAEDESGNIATANITVTLLDTISPVLDIDASHTLQLDANGSASLSINDVDIASSDNCAIDSRSLSQSLFDCDDLGTNTITFTARDAGGNATSQTVTVIVEDNIDPVASASDIIRNLNSDGEVVIDADDIDNGSSDNCDIVSKTLSQTTFGCDDIGVNTVTLTVTDAAGNSDQVTATVTIQDVTKPVFVNFLEDNDTLRLNQFGRRLVTVPGIIGDVVDNCTDDANITISVSYTNSCTNVTKSGTSIMLDCSDDSRACSLTDDGDLRRFVITATDEYNNTTEITRDYFVIDLFAPNVFPENLTLYLPEDPGGNAEVVTDAGRSTGNEAGTALDPVGLDSASYDSCAIVSIGLLETVNQQTATQTITYTCEDLGANTYWLRASDTYDNRASYSGVVTIVDTIKPDISPSLGSDAAKIYVDQRGIATLDPEDLIQTASDNISSCGLTTTASRTVYSCTDDVSFNASIVNPDRLDALNPANWGTLEVQATVTDICG
jgi:hypothetical protein